MLKLSSRKHFQGHSRAEYLWSMIIMCDNVNASLREPEAPSIPSEGIVIKAGGNNNENTSYNSKIKNAVALSDVYALIEKLKLEVFRGDLEAEKDFQDQKYSTEGGTFMDRLRRKESQ